MKEYILNLLKSALEDNRIQTDSDNYDIAFLKDLVDRVSNEKEYFYKFILDLDSELIKEITLLVEPSGARESFLASIVYLKKLLEINDEEDVQIPLSQNQEELLYQLLELIKKIIEKDDQISDARLKYLRKNAKNLGTLNSKIKKGSPLDVEDYDLIENLIRDNETGNVTKRLNEVVDYLNEFNNGVLPEFKPQEEVVPEPQEEVHEELPEAPAEETEVISVKQSIDFDIFDPQSFVYDASEEPPKKRGRKKKEKVQEEVEEVIELSNIDRSKLDKYKEELMDEKSLNDLFNFFKINNLSDETINDLVSRCTPIFFEKNRDSFKENVRIALTYGANIEKLIKNNITFFYNSPEYNFNKINLLDRKGLNINLLFNSKPELLAIGLDKLIKNIDTLKRYNLEILPEDYDSLAILAASHLNSIIDTFIEAGFSAYLATNGLKNIRSLIIKRIFYAYKNELDVWKENISPDRVNEEYEGWLNKELVILDAEEISYLINDYPLLESIEETKRPAFFTDADGASVRRLYEFKFDNIIISRIKTYSVFKVLINHEVDIKEALVYALTYNLNVDNSDYELIKNEILGK